ncbi:hypothetical protein, variant 3 [Aphanomyces astaci]|uniref:Uncharacterized protein n=1 Tax=Aphanomyces astaci TaxID=112090 RepID=W4FI01_APHAT|nr:hypothetical protein, variant 3 [Aphanomyces astaci]ETV66456.1 hypothetical protein, variant 3 [Aphanomyces astaci]|eukprot:XP_009844089.1 hypothetical protein, variant 3 [Aphanomyces astaci]
MHNLPPLLDITMSCRLAIKQDTATRMQMYVILADAGCDINHIDLRGWSCVHYACATGAEDVLHDLLRRGADVSFNRFGYCGDMDLLFPRIVHARSLLQHTEQLTHNDQVQRCWSIFHRHMQSTGYLLHTHTDVHTFQTPLKLSFHAPMDHSALDRIRIVDVHSPQPISQQLSKTFLVPPGAVGSFTLDAEVLHRPSLFHVYYEQHLAMPMPLPLHALERSLGVKDLDSGRTVSAQAANDAVLAALESMRSSCEPHHRVDIPTDDAESSTSSSVECTQVDNEWGGGCSYRCVAMLTLSLVPPTKPTKPHPHGHHFLTAHGRHEPQGPAGRGRRLRCIWPAVSAREARGPTGGREWQHGRVRRSAAHYMGAQGCQEAAGAAVPTPRWGTEKY